MSRRTYTPEQRAEALALYEEHGPREAARRCGIDATNITRWAKAAGVVTRAIETKGVAIKASVLSMEQRKLNLAAGLMDDIERLRAQLWAPCVERKAMVVAQGLNAGSAIEVAEVEHDQPTFGDQKSIMTSLAIAVDKVQILTGDVTARTEHVGDDPRSRLSHVRDELAARRNAA